TDTGTPFVIMELLEGETLASWLARDGVIDLDDVARMIEAIGGALDAVHAAQLIHRDVKPHNIFVSRGRQSDVYSVGVCLWEAIVGRRLFRAPNDGSTELQDGAVCSLRTSWLTGSAGTIRVPTSTSFATPTTSRKRPTTGRCARAARR